MIVFTSINIFHRLYTFDKSTSLRNVISLPDIELLIKINDNKILKK